MCSGDTDGSLLECPDMDDGYPALPLWLSLSTARSWLRALRSGSGLSLSLTHSLYLATAPALVFQCYTPTLLSRGPGDIIVRCHDGDGFLIFKKTFNAWFDYYLIVKGSWSPQFLGSFSHGAPFCRMLSRSFCRNGGVLCKYDRGRGIVMGITHTAHKSFSLKNGRIFTKYSTFTICVEHSIFSTSSCNRFTVL